MTNSSSVGCFFCAPPRANKIFSLGYRRVNFKEAYFYFILVTVDCSFDQWRAQELCSEGGGGFQQIQLRTEDRENGDMRAVAR